MKKYVIAFPYVCGRRSVTLELNEMLNEFNGVKAPEEGWFVWVFCWFFLSLGFIGIFCILVLDCFCL